MSERSDSLAILRQQLDQLDSQLIEILARRMQHVKEAGEYKKAHDLPALDESRWQEASQARLELARTLGLPENLVSDMYELIHKYTVQMERDLGAK